MDNEGGRAILDRLGMKKKILVTGENSYIARSFRRYMEQWGMSGQTVSSAWSAHETGQITLLSVRDSAWQQEDFSQYDAVIHCAGIVHQKGKNISAEEYDRVNRKLTLDLAKKAQNEGVRQFIFISTMNVYGVSTGVITPSTEPNPQSLYGKSKIEAEKELQGLQSDDFKVCIVRPPMIYGNACKGNYRPLAKLARLTPIFPDIKNERSMLYIDNLCELLRLVVENEDEGVFFPQDKEYVRTSGMVKQIAACHGRKPALTKVFNPMIRLLLGVGLVKKVFGSLVYEKSMSVYDKGEYRIKEFPQAIKESEE